MPAAVCCCAISIKIPHADPTNDVLFDNVERGTKSAIGITFKNSHAAAKYVLMQQQSDQASGILILIDTHLSASLSRCIYPSSAPGTDTDMLPQVLRRKAAQSESIHAL
jgi:hypothetical protein